MTTGHIQAACWGKDSFSEYHLSSIASYYRVDVERLRGLLAFLEGSERPEIALLQNPAATGEIRAICFVSSVWSRSYKLLRCPSEQVHRDFHYQCLFTSMELLAEVGCSVFRVESLRSGFFWQRDAFICLLEAWRNVTKLVSPNCNVQLIDETFEKEMVDEVTRNLGKYGPEDHRPIGMAPYIREGFNMHRIFLPESSRRGK